MKRIQIHRYGGPEEMHLEDYRLPELAADEIRVRTRTASINPVDWKIRNGTMKIMAGRKFPRGIGQDFSGVVEGVGQDVTRFKVGDEVLGATPLKTSGAFAEALITKEALAVAKPPALSYEEAATLPTAAGTAWTALVQKARLRTGQAVFINGAYGAVGQAAVQIAKALGASVTARVSADSMAAVTGIGADTVLDYRQSIPQRLSGNYDVVFDTHGGLTIKEGGRLAKSDGVILDISPSMPKLLLSILSPNRKFVVGKQDEATLGEVASLASQGKLKITIGRTVPLADGIPLIKTLEGGERIKGKGVIACDA